MLEVLAPLLLCAVLPFEGAEEGAESAFLLPASNTIVITRLLASRFVAEIARVYPRARTGYRSIRKAAIDSQ